MPRLPKPPGKTPNTRLRADFGLSYRQLNFGWEGGWNIGRGLFWTLFIESSLLFCLMIGGLAVWRHALIRLLLHQARVFPWRSSQFLENARERILLQRLGGGYSFIHRLFLDYQESVREDAYH